MTAGATLPATATATATSVSPTPRQVWTTSRGVVFGVLLALVAGFAYAALRSGAQHGALDPRSADPNGSRAVAELLADHGVSTRVVTTLHGAAVASGPDTTLVVAVPDLLTHRQQEQLHRAVAGAGGRTVLVAPGSWSVERLAPGVTADPAQSFQKTLAPVCLLAEAQRAGAADTGGIRYSTTHLDADSCYPSKRLATLLRLPSAAGGDTVILGASDILRNERLDRQGNASLALQLLGTRTHLVWYLPSLTDTTATGNGRSSLIDLLPSGWLWGALQLFIAAAVAALWRARRHGPLVPEKLPVAIRASETVEGRARLYRKADARDRAAAALRSTTRTRLAPLVGVPVTQAHAPEALLPALSAHLRRDGATTLHPLLFGPPPGDDTALIALIDQLDALEREVRRP
ncbi:DUF4350 domain-containing protein [Streptomyces mangrovisoli]|uniref:DUF4350 domain-containing protein n=1 Tax=Streptomyces mangrovisoli TaxID=1428628 RepID=A0A1J4NY96_9ACTN|nr:DUF4350 domain-containing protein [Streptomyces mangrovisoli]OIJ66110.1 hypothetical protein WN71_020140 [Streptomyces mangrovisoli]